MYLIKFKHYKNKFKAFLEKFKPFVIKLMISWKIQNLCYKANNQCFKESATENSFQHCVLLATSVVGTLIQIFFSLKTLHVPWKESTLLHPLFCFESYYVYFISTTESTVKIYTFHGEKCVSVDTFNMYLNGHLKQCGLF